MLQRPSRRLNDLFAQRCRQNASEYNAAAMKSWATSNLDAVRNVLEFMPDNQFSYSRNSIPDLKRSLGNASSPHLLGHTRLLRAAAAVQLRERAAGGSSQSVHGRGVSWKA